MVSCNSKMSHYVRLYSGAEPNYQAGYGLSGINVYRGPLHRQSGAGLGNFFTAAVRYLRPLLSSGINALTNQGINSASSVLSQLGKKDLKTILSEESEKAVKNLSEKAINQIKRGRGEVPETQLGSGMELLPLLKPKKRRKKMSPRKSIKKSVKRIKRQTRVKRKVGRTAISAAKRQIGKGKRRKRKKTSCKKRKQIGSGRVKKSSKKQSNKSKLKKLQNIKSLDIFDS